MTTICAPVEDSNHNDNREHCGVIHLFDNPHVTIHNYIHSVAWVADTSSRKFGLASVVPTTATVTDASVY